MNSSMTFDKRTENAVKRFQRRIRVGANGIVDHRTWVRMTSRSWTMDNFRVNSQKGVRIVFWTVLDYRLVVVSVLFYG